MSSEANKVVEEALSLPSSERANLVEKLISSLNLPLQEEIVFAGGCAYNPCLKTLFEQTLKKRIRVAAAPEMVGALGAALLAEEERTSCKNPCEIPQKI